MNKKVNANKNTDTSVIVLPHGLAVVLTVAFIGIILSLTVLFGISAILGTDEIYEDYYDGEDHPDIFWTEFSDMFYKSSELRELIVNYDYLLYGKLPTSSVIRGKNNFLFDMGTVDDGTDYSYIGDYLGQTAPDDEALAALAGGISALRDGYADAGIYCLVAVIPNAQTVYSEYMPDYFGDISDNTRLESLDDYMKDKGYDGYIDLTDALLNAKENGQLYNNTENSLNALGAYYVYRAVLDALPDEYTAELTPLERENITIYSHNTDGKELARNAGISELISNKTLSLSTGFLQMYTVAERTGDMRMTYVMPEYSDILPDSVAVRFTFTGEWDRILLTDYFSNTFGVAGYLSGASTIRTVPDGTETDNVGFNVAVVFVHEYELGLLLAE